MKIVKKKVARPKFANWHVRYNLYYNKGLIGYYQDGEIRLMYSDINSAGGFMWRRINQTYTSIVSAVTFLNINIKYFVEVTHKIYG